MAFLRSGALYPDCGVPRDVWDGVRAVRRVSPLVAAASGLARAGGVRARGRAGVQRFGPRACLGALYEARLQCVSACHDLQGSAVDVCFEPAGRAPLLLACSVTGTVADAQQSVAAAATHTAVLYNYRTGRAWPLEAHGNNTVSAVGFVDGSTKALSAGFDGNLCLWDISACASRDCSTVPLISQIKCLFTSLLSVSHYVCSSLVCLSMLSSLSSHNNHEQLQQQNQNQPSTNKTNHETTDNNEQP